jgi:hypothetical protein
MKFVAIHMVAFSAERSPPKCERDSPVVRIRRARWCLHSSDAFAVRLCVHEPRIRRDLNRADIDGSNRSPRDSAPGGGARRVVHPLDKAPTPPGREAR